MVDRTIDETCERIRYELGRGNWENREIPDLRNPGDTATIAENRLVDVIILGDGYTDPADFRAQLQRWLDDFFALDVYERFAGAFRVRALYTASDEPASKDRGSYYRVPIKENDTSILDSSGWWAAGDADGLVFRERLFEAVDSFPDVNLRRYPESLSLGNENTAIGNWLRNLYRNLVQATEVVS